MITAYQENKLPEWDRSRSNSQSVSFGVEFNVLDDFTEFVGKLEADAYIAVFVNLDVVYKLH